MRTARIAMTALLLAPNALAAEELQFGVRSGFSWNENVFGVSEDAQLAGEDEDPTDDFSLRVDPFVSAVDRDGDLTWSLRYGPSYERYLEQSELSGFDQDFLGDLSWRFAKRWSFSLQEAYSLNRNSIRFNEAADPGEEVALGFEEREVRSSRTSAVLSHSLSPLDGFFLTASYNTFEYPDAGGNDRSTPSIAAAYQRMLSERTTAGLRLSWIQQSQDNNVDEADSTDFYNIAATLEHSFSRTLRLSASAGPTLVDSTPLAEFEPFEFAVLRVNTPGGRVFAFAIDAAGCNFQGVPGRAGISNFEGCSGNLPGLSPADNEILSKLTAEVPTVDEQGRPVDAGDASEMDLTYFASLSLQKDWESWNGSLSYRRSNSESARFGSSSVADTVSGSLTWRPSRLWTLTLLASMSIQEQAVDQVVPIAFEVANVPAPPGVTSVTQLAQVQRIVATTSDDAEEYQFQSVSFRAVRQLTKHSSVFARAWWYHQEQDGSLTGRDSEWNNLVLWVGFDWKFDPIRF